MLIDELIYVHDNACPALLTFQTISFRVNAVNDFAIILMAQYLRKKYVIQQHLKAWLY